MKYKHVCEGRRAIGAQRSTINDGLSLLRRSALWGECTAEAIPLARRHAELERYIRELRIAGLSPRRVRDAQALRASAASLALAVREVVSVAGDWVAGTGVPARLLRAADQIEVLAERMIEGRPPLD